MYAHTGAYFGLSLVCVLCLIFAPNTNAQTNFPDRRSRMIIAPSDRSALTGYADDILATKGAINIASAYCYSLGTLAPNQTLPADPFCAPFNTALAGKVLLHPVVTFGGENAIHNFDKASQFLELFLPEAVKNGYAGYYFDVEFHGSGDEDRKYHEFLHAIGTVFNSQNISVTVLWRDSHSTPLEELNITNGVNSLSVEQEGDHCSAVRTFIGAMGSKYKSKGGTLLYPKSGINNQACINAIFETLKKSGAPELGYFANFSDMNGDWWAPMLQWVTGNATAADAEAGVRSGTNGGDWRKGIPELTQSTVTAARRAAVSAIEEWQQAQGK